MGDCDVVIRMRSTGKNEGNDQSIFRLPIHYT